jgi:diacylglycerol kinase (ATP)
MNNRIIFIVNPISGKGKGKGIKPVLESFFKNKAYDIDIIFADYAGHAKEIVKDQIKLNPSVIVACGGDGTISEVAESLVGTTIPLGILPIGSGNGLASNLNISKDIEIALNTILEYNVLTIDVGKINDRYFFSNIGLGIDANVIHRYTEKKQRNFVGYFKASIWSFLNFKPINYKVKFDGLEQIENDYFFVLCSNSNEAGYGISFTPDAKLNDGKIDVICVEKLNMVQYLQFFYAVLFRKINSFDKAVLKQVNHVVFETNQHALKMQIDGEAVVSDVNRIEVSVIPQSLNVLVSNKSK